MRGALDPSTWGVRMRSALAATVVVAAALILVSAGLLLLLRSSLRDSADAATAGRAAQVADALRSENPADQDSTVLATTGTTAVVQVLDPAGKVLLASRGAPPVPLGVPLGDGQTAHLGAVDAPGYRGELRVSAQGTTGPGGPVTVVVAADDSGIDETLTTVAALLGLGLPVVVLLVGVATYVLVGRSLRPVDEMRATVDAVSAADLADRLPVPRPRDEISRLAVTLNSMLARLQTSHLAQRRFVGDASHELRSPLATITAALELAQDRPEVLDRELVQAHLLPEAERMRHLVSDLLLLAKADENGLPMHVTDVDIDDVVELEGTRLRSAFPRLVVTVVTAPTRVRGDEGQLARVVRNLSDNAARHAATRVALSSAVSGGAATIVVDDDGPGVPPTDRARIFERFVRLDLGRARDAGGSGLGLAITAEIVASHRGSIRVLDSPAGGARFEVTVPTPS